MKRSLKTVVSITGLLLLPSIGCTTEETFSNPPVPGEPEVSNPPAPEPLDTGGTEDSGDAEDSGDSGDSGDSEDSGTDD